MKKIIKWLWVAVKSLLMLMGLGTAVMIAGIVILVSSFSSGKIKSDDVVSRIQKNEEKKLPENAILFINFADGLAKQKIDANLQQFFGDTILDSHSLLLRVKNAVKDDRIRGLAVDLRGAKLSLAEREDLISSVKAFEELGKKTTVYTDNFEMGAQGLLDYALAATFDRVVLHPSGSVTFSGFAAEMPFFNNTLKNNLGVTPQFFRFSENKTGANNITENAFTKEHRAELQNYLQSFSDIVTNRIMESRGLSQAQMDLLFEKTMLDAKNAKDSGLVDKLATFEEFLETSKTWVAIGEHEKDKIEGVEYVNVLDYPFESLSSPPTIANKNNSKAEKPLADKKQNKNDVALIYITGPIMDGYEPEDGVFSSGKNVYAMTLADRIKQAVDDNVKAIILRIDSPGGSYTASHVIRDAVLFAKSHGVPVVASIADMAASGGYFVAMDADYIVAPETSVVGSIGVFGGKFVTADLSKKLDVNWDNVTIQPHALMWSMQHPFTPAESQMVSNSLKLAFDTFGGLVKAGRKLSDEQAKKAIGGQFFTGRDAKAIKLIDQFGNLEDAIVIAAKLVKTDRSLINLVVYPKIDDFVHSFVRMLALGFGNQSQASIFQHLTMNYDSDLAVYSQMALIMSKNNVLIITPPLKIANEWVGW